MGKKEEKKKHQHGGGNNSTTTRSSKGQRLVMRLLFLLSLFPFFLAVTQPTNQVLQHLTENNNKAKEDDWFSWSAVQKDMEKVLQCGPNGNGTTDSVRDLFCGWAAAAADNNNNNNNNKNATDSVSWEGFPPGVLPEIWRRYRQTLWERRRNRNEHGDDEKDDDEKDDDEKDDDAAELRSILERAQASRFSLVGNNVTLHVPLGAKNRGVSQVLAELSAPRGSSDFNLQMVVEKLFPTGIGALETTKDKEDENAKLFVDIGSNLGLVTLALLLEVPIKSVSVVSIEAALPNYCYQLLNLGRNLPPEVFFDESLLRVFPFGLGNSDTSIVNMIWQPELTLGTSDWRLRSDMAGTDMVDIGVHMRTLRTLLARHLGRNNNNNDKPPPRMHLVKLDLEGGEYNAVPEWTEEEFAAMDSMVGEVHWGFIPDKRKPSSARAEATHRRICQYENVARRAKECCAFPDLAVKDLPGASTVRQVAGSLCDNFDAWAQEKKLFDIASNDGWNQPPE